MLNFNIFKKPVSAFLRGIGSVIDIYGSTSRFTLQELFPYYGKGTPEEVDATAIAHDWNMVGKDLENAMENYDTKTPGNISDVSHKLYK